MKITSLYQIEDEMKRLQARCAEATKHGDSQKVRACYARASHLELLADRIGSKVGEEVGALRRMGGGRCMREVVELGWRAIKRRHKFNPMHGFKGLIGRGFIVELEPQRRTHSMALHKQVIGRCTRIVEAGDVEFSVADGKICASVPHSFEFEPVEPNQEAQRRIDRLEAWKARQGVHAAFNGKMTAGYWVGEARKIMSRLIRDRKSGLYYAVNDARWQRFMQYARIALHGQVYAFKYHNRFVGYITAMNLEAARRNAEDQAMSFSPTAPIEQIRSGIQLKVGY